MIVETNVEKHRMKLKYYSKMYGKIREVFRIAHRTFRRSSLWCEDKRKVVAHCKFLQGLEVHHKEKETVSTIKSSRRKYFLQK